MSVDTTQAPLAAAQSLKQPANGAVLATTDSPAEPALPQPEPTVRKLHRWMWTTAALTASVALAATATGNAVDHVLIPGLVLGLAALSAVSIAVATERTLRNAASPGNHHGRLRTLLRISQLLIGAIAAALLIAGGWEANRFGSASFSIEDIATHFPLTQANVLTYCGLVANAAGWILLVICTCVALWRGGPLYSPPGADAAPLVGAAPAEAV